MFSELKARRTPEDTLSVPTLIHRPAATGATCNGLVGAPWVGSSQGLIGDYALTLAVFANFAAAASLPALLHMLEAVRRPVVIAASFTLSLYLYHMPLLVLAVWLFGLSQASGLQGVCTSTAFVAIWIVPLWLVTDQQRWRVHAWLVSLGARRIGTEHAKPG